MKRKEQILALLSDAWKCRGQGNYEEAKRLARQAQVLCDDEDHICLGRVFHVYMQIEYDHDRHTVALDLARQSLAHYRASKDQQRIAHSLRHVADLLRKMSHHGESEKNYQRAIQLYRSDQKTVPLDLANALRGYALLLERANRAKEAVVTWTEARDLYEICNIDEGVQEANRHIDKSADLS